MKLEKIMGNQKIALGILAVGTVGILWGSSVIQKQVDAAYELRLQQEAAWAEEMARVEAEQEMLRLRAEFEENCAALIGGVTLKSDGQPLTMTPYLPTKLDGESQPTVLAEEMELLGTGSQLTEGATVELLLSHAKPVTVMIWRDPVGKDTPAESVNYKREERDTGIAYSFNAAFGKYDSVAYRFDIKLDEKNQGQIGFLATCPAES